MKWWFHEYSITCANFKIFEMCCVFQIKYWHERLLLAITYKLFYKTETFARHCRYLIAPANSSINNSFLAMQRWQNDAVHLLIEAQNGFTNKLYQAGINEDHEFLTLFSGPHGTAVSMGNFGTVLMFATDIGIAAQLPYLRSLIDNYNQCRIRARRILLVWQLHEPGKQKNATG